MELWSNIQANTPELIHFDYEKIPRGRAIYDVNKKKLIIYLDQKLLFKDKVQKIYDFFNTASHEVILKKDPHYQTKC